MNRTLVLALALCAPATAFAYIDPGTGALLVQGLVGALAAVSLFWRRVKAYVGSWLPGRSAPEQREINDMTSVSDGRRNPDEGKQYKT